MTTMSMRERRKKIEQLVKQNPRVKNCANTFNEDQARISQWHEHNDALCATDGALNELDELLTYSEAALDALKLAKNTAYNQLMSQYPHVWDTSCADPFNTGTQLDELLTYSEAALDALKLAKNTAYNQLMSQYPHVWDTSCADPFNTGTQSDATDAGAETEEMGEVTKLGGNTPVFTISADKFVELFDQLENFYKARTKFCEDESLDSAVPREGLKAVQILHRQLLQLIDQAKEATNA